MLILAFDEVIGSLNEKFPFFERLTVQLQFIDSGDVMLCLKEAAFLYGNANESFQGAASHACLFRTAQARLKVYYCFVAFSQGPATHSHVVAGLRVLEATRKDLL
jgi:hypothetical protein